MENEPLDWSQFGKNSFDAFLTAPKSKGIMALTVVIFMYHYYTPISGEWDHDIPGGFMRQYCEEVDCDAQLTYMLTLFMLFIQYFQRFPLYYLMQSCQVN